MRKAKEVVRPRFELGLGAAPDCADSLAEPRHYTTPCSGPLRDCYGSVVTVSVAIADLIVSEALANSRNNDLTS